MLSVAILPVTEIVDRWLSALKGDVQLDKFDRSIKFEEQCSASIASNSVLLCFV